MTDPQAAGDTQDAAGLVAAGALRRPIEEELQGAGLEVLGRCEALSREGDLLRESPLLQDFSAPEADLLGQAMVRVRAKDGQVLIAEDAASDWMVLLLSGTVDVVKRRVAGDGQADREGAATRVAVVRAGAVLGEMSMLDGEPRYASCLALGDVQAAVLTRQAVAGLIQDQPAVGAKLLVKITQLLAQRLRNTSNQLLRQLQRGA